MKAPPKAKSDDPAGPSAPQAEPKKARSKRTPKKASSAKRKESPDKPSPKAKVPKLEAEEQPEAVQNADADVQAGSPVEPSIESEPSPAPKDDAPSSRPEEVQPSGEASAKVVEDPRSDSDEFLSPRSSPSVDDCEDLMAPVIAKPSARAASKPKPAPVIDLNDASDDDLCEISGTEFGQAVVDTTDNEAYEEYDQHPLFELMDMMKARGLEFRTSESKKSIIQRLIQDDDSFPLLQPIQPEATQEKPEQLESSIPAPSDRGASSSHAEADQVEQDLQHGLTAADGDQPTHTEEAAYYRPSSPSWESVEETCGIRRITNEFLVEPSSSCLASVDDNATWLKQRQTLRWIERELSAEVVMFDGQIAALESELERELDAIRGLLAHRPDAADVIARLRMGIPPR